MKRLQYSGFILTIGALFFPLIGNAKVNAIQVLKLNYSNKCDDFLVKNKLPYITGVIETQNKLVRYHYALGKKNEELILLGIDAREPDSFALSKATPTEVGDYILAKQKKLSSFESAHLMRSLQMKYIRWVFNVKKSSCDPVSHEETYLYTKRPGAKELMDKSLMSPVSTIKTVEIDSDIFEALKMAPFIALRDDQFNNRYTDGLLAVGYTSIKSKENKRIVTYTSYFSDEDSKTDAEGIADQFKQWGRSFDIEATNRYVFLPEGKEDQAQSYFHSSLFWNSGIGHFFIKIEPDQLGGLSPYEAFDGAALKNSTGWAGGHFWDWPNTKHNVFEQVDLAAPKTARPYGYHYVPKALAPGRSREQLVFDHPWILNASRREQIVEKKFPAEFLDSIIFELSLEKSVGGPAQVAVYFENQVAVVSGDKDNERTELYEGKLKKVGHASNEKSALLMTPFKQEWLDQISGLSFNTLVFDFIGNDDSRLVNGFRYKVPAKFRDQFNRYLDQNRIVFKVNGKRVVRVQPSPNWLKEQRLPLIWGGF